MYVCKIQESRMREKRESGMRVKEERFAQRGEKKGKSFTF